MNAISAIHSQAVLYRHTTTHPQPTIKAGNCNQVTNPAVTARAALADGPDLPSKPFGSFVSLIARGWPMPPFENADTVAPSPETESAETRSDATSP